MFWLAFCSLFFFRWLMFGLLCSAEASGHMACLWKLSAISYCNPAATRLRPRWKSVLMICLDVQETEGRKTSKSTGEFESRNIQPPFVSRAKAGICFCYERDKIAFPTGFAFFFFVFLSFSSSSSGTGADLLSLTETRRIRPHAPYTCHTGKEGHLFISQNSSITP